MTAATRLIYDPTTPQQRQKDSWSCLAKSVKWCVSSLGLVVPDRQIEVAIRRCNIVSGGGYLVDKTGHDIRDWAQEQFVELGVVAQYTPSVTFDEVALSAGRYPVIIGGSLFLHYTAVRGYDPTRDLLLLANSSPGWQAVYDTMSRRQFESKRPIALIRVAPPQVIKEGRHHGPQTGVGTAGLYRTIVVGGASLVLPHSVGERRTAPQVGSSGVGTLVGAQ